ncbi:MAG: HAD-IA family hydrolase, partial [Propionivibrio sp.]
LVTSADVAQGKPHPECYLRALDLLGVSADQALVFEDAQAGLESGRAAGCRTIAVATTSQSDDLEHENWVHDLSCVVLENVLADGTLQLRIH